MADLASLGAANHASLAHAVGREVVVKQEVLLTLTLNGIDNLCITCSTQGCDCDSLGFAAGEQG